MPIGTFRERDDEDCGSLLADGALVELEDVAFSAPSAPQLVSVALF